MRWPNCEVILKTLFVVPGQTGVPASKPYRPSEVMQRGFWLPEIGPSQVLEGPSSMPLQRVIETERALNQPPFRSSSPDQLPKHQLESPVKIGYLPPIGLRARSSHFAWWDRRTDSRVLAIKGFSDKRLLDRKIRSNRGRREVSKHRIGDLRRTWNLRTAGPNDATGLDVKSSSGPEDGNI
jgi:hypothetical protein